MILFRKIRKKTIEQININQLVKQVLHFFKLFLFNFPRRLLKMTSWGKIIFWLFTQFLMFYRFSQMPLGLKINYYNFRSDPFWWKRNNKLNWFFNSILANQYIHCSESRVESIERPYSLEYRIKQIFFWILAFSSQSSRFEILRTLEMKFKNKINLTKLINVNGFDHKNRRGLLNCFIRQFELKMIGFSKCSPFSPKMATNKVRQSISSNLTEIKT